VAPAGLFATPASDADVRFWHKADIRTPICCDAHSRHSVW
jgi:hypothetical protein